MQPESDVIRRFILPVFGDWDVGEITAKDVLDWQRAINEKGCKYKSKIYLRLYRLAELREKVLRSI